MFLQEKIDELYRVKDYDGVIAYINAEYDGKEMPPKTERQLALAYYYKADYKNSLKHFEHIAAQEETTENLFNVMTSYLALKDIGGARTVFGKIIETHRGALSTGQGKNFVPQLCIPYLRYYYACGLVDAGAFEEAYIQLEELKKVYLCVRITDDTFLYMRGIPFFGRTLELAKKIFDGLNKEFKSSAFLEDLAAAVDADGQDLIKKYSA